MHKKQLQKIREALAWGCSDAEACHYAGVTLRLFEKYTNRNAKFREEKIKLQTMPIVLLKKRLFEAIGEAKPETCLKILEKQEQKETPEIDFEEIMLLEKSLKKS